MTAPSSGVLIVVPMKEPSAAKTRLCTVLSAVNRSFLARALFSSTLDLLGDLKAGDGGKSFDFAVVTRSAEIKRKAAEKGAFVIAETPSGSLCQALQTAADWALEKRYRAICVLPADLVAPDPSEIAALLDQARSDPCVILCPASDYGTNALLMSPPNAIPFHYGKRSFFKHYQAAEKRGIQPVVMPMASLRHDVDTASDLDYLIHIKPEFAYLRGPEC